MLAEEFIPILVNHHSEWLRCSDCSLENYGKIPFYGIDGGIQELTVNGA